MGCEMRPVCPAFADFLLDSCLELGQHPDMNPYRLIQHTLLLCLLTAWSGAFPLSAAQTRSTTYESAGAIMEGFVALPELQEGEYRPGILLIHDWTGLQDYAKDRARQIANELGYVCFAADVYGKGVRPENPQECGVQAGIYRGDRTLFRQRLNDALAELRKLPGCHPDHIAAIGYCFGGTGVIELARSGAPVLGVVSFHGGLDSPKPEDGQHIQGKVLVLHGADDPFVSEKNLTAFVAEMNRWNVDWQMVSYGGAVHSFTKKEAGDNKESGAAYNADADRRSWRHMKQFFTEIFPHAQKGWSSLFDGRSLTGWVQKNGTATYEVQDGVILGTTSEGSPNSFLCTTRDYRDFELLFEVKVDDSLNSGVQIRSRSLGTFNDGRVHGPQVEIATNGDAGWVYGEALGTGWLSADRSDENARAAFKKGEWNKYRVRAVGNHIRTWINGIPVADLQGDENSFKEGFIGLQVHGIQKGTGPYEVRWRNIYLKSLE
jgi:dienelactone hydrolase